MIRAAIAALSISLLCLPPEGGSHRTSTGGGLSWLPPSGGSSAAAFADQEWTQWRGPSRNGVVAPAAVPKWPTQWKKAWRVEVGEGYSSPVVAGNRVFVHSRKDPNEIVTAYVLELGHIAWQHQYKADFAKNQYATGMGKAPFATPLVSGERLFTLGGTGILCAWNTRTGAMLWLKDYSSLVDTSKLFTGTAASPLMEGGLLIVQVGSDVKGGQVVALDPATGNEKWTWKGKGPGYASPVAVSVGSSRQIVTMTDGSIEGIDAKSGESLWSVPFPDDWHENIVTPIWTGTHLIVSGTRQGTHAYTLKQAEGKWQATEAWKNPEVAMYMSTPVLSEGVLYGLSAKKKGQVVAIDAASGAVKWMTDGRAADHASILLAGNNVLLMTTAGELIVVKRSPLKYEEEKRYTLADAATWAVPAVLPDALIVRDVSGLMRLVGS
jgi:outer membrane protein assembly factor BamB